jgi:magnesium-transporting ATPase (P-type)
MKKETVAAMEKLNKANIHSVMVTGDNALTAIKVA